MTKQVPHAKLYKTVSNLSNALNWLLISSTIISLAIIVLNNFNIEANPNISLWLSRILALIAIIFFILEVIQSQTYHRAELQRKNDFMDNSLETKLADANSNEYYTNDDISNGVYKMGVNCFENSFFTKNISSKMLTKQITYTIVIWVVLWSVILTAPNNVFVEVILLALPFSVANDLRKLYRLNKNVEMVFANFKKIFSTTKKSKRESLIIDNVISYEKSISYSSVPLNRKIFDKWNDKLSLEWNKIKKQHKIK
ncbi:hypothetical protein HSX10_18425 [Winogradskyella undariae]|uniref:hypothetical protein n=1 Tax=Winogradskyella undariae TaxID=1285465 RepID=UPI00156B5478|nr:hypothetical protein [Winogradskyella undariae]NRR93553.1 hypothetical protein [Winogradskyella undariae]